MTVKMIKQVPLQVYVGRFSINNVIAFNNRSNVSTMPFDEPL